MSISLILITTYHAGSQICIFSEDDSPELQPLASLSMGHKLAAFSIAWEFVMNADSQVPPRPEPESPI